MMQFIKNCQVIIIETYKNIVNDSQFIAFTEICKDVPRKKKKKKRRKKIQLLISKFIR